ncbi:MAG TPA: SCO family protein [Croceibacterium sp.]|nr:SCO family protein [Croceibacterium sp.]
MSPRPGMLLAVVLLASSCQSNSSTTAGEAPLAGASIGGPFTLVDKNGKTVRWNDFDGKYRVVYFGYTYCPDVCPMDVARLMKGYAQFKKDEPQLAAQVQPIFISIDPERDTPKVVGEFAGAFSDDLIGLTGTPEQVKVAADAFKVFYKKGEIAGNGQYLMDHSTAAYLMGRKGEPLALLPVDVVDQGQAIAAELEKWTS